MHTMLFAEPHLERGAERSLRPSSTNCQDMGDRPRLTCQRHSRAHVNFRPQTPRSNSDKETWIQEPITLAGQVCPRPQKKSLDLGSDRAGGLPLHRASPGPNGGAAFSDLAPAAGIALHPRSVHHALGQMSRAILASGALSNRTALRPAPGDNLGRLLPAVDCSHCSHCSCSNMSLAEASARRNVRWKTAPRHLTLPSGISRSRAPA